MSEFQDLTDQKFGEWTVLRRATPRGPNPRQMTTYWLCRCSCGAEKEVPSYPLQHGRSTRCDRCRRADLSARSKGRRENLAGRTFGRWTVLEAKEPPNWLCRCECGYEGKVSGGNLRRGLSRGCFACYRGRRTENLVGQRFGSLTVVKQVESDNGSRWLCLCEPRYGGCGKTTVVKGGNLRSLSTKSCGCLKGRSGKTAFQDLTGRVFGRLVALKRSDKADSQGHRKYWVCLCDPRYGGCGKRKVVTAQALRDGNVQSCGCLRAEMTIAKNTKHGYAGRGSKHPDYEIWLGMIKRCYNKNTRSYPDYGGRGIRVCSLWRSSFPNFFGRYGAEAGTKGEIQP